MYGRNSHPIRTADIVSRMCCLMIRAWGASHYFRSVSDCVEHISSRSERANQVPNEGWRM